MNQSSLWLLAAFIVLPSVARADRVLLYSVAGRADDARIQEVEESLSSILRAQGHTVAPPASAARPTTHAAMDTAAAATQASYVLVADVEPLPGQYRLHLLVYYRPAGRLEELLVEVLLSEEQARLRDVLHSMVRPEGLGEDAVRLTGAAETAEQRAAREAEAQRQREAQDTTAHDAEAQRQREAAEAEAHAQQERDAQAQREREQREHQAQTAWDSRAQYASDGPWMIQGGLSGRYLGALTTPMMIGAMTPSLGGGLFEIDAQVAHRIDGLAGFELRGGIDIVTGVIEGLGLNVGAAWLGSFFTEPIYIGAAADIGALFTFTGQRNVMFSVHVAPVLSWRPVAHVYIELAAPELGLLASGTSALTVGATARVGYRF